MNSDGDKVYKEIVAEHNMKRQKKDKIYKTIKQCQIQHPNLYENN